MMGVRVMLILPLLLLLRQGLRLPTRGSVAGRV
jgi:hypothetical protein